jgi:NADH dehydrogenase (ubiquinone) 1 beta subcomplex subunit 8
MWGPDIPPIAPQAALRQLLIAFAGFATFGFVVKKYVVQDPPAIRREYPYSGLVQELGGLEENKVGFYKFRASFQSNNSLRRRERKVS